MQPIDYTIEAADPFRSALQGYQAGAAIRDDQRQQQQLIAQQQAQQRMHEELADLFDNPTAGAREYGAMIAKYPPLAEPLKTAFNMGNEAQQASQLGLASRTYAALVAGKQDVAERLMRDEAQAYRNSGREEDARAYETWADIIKDAPGQARTMGGLLLAANMGTDKFSSTFADIVREGRAEELQPAAVDRARAEASSATTEAVFAPQKAQADLRKYAAELGLTEAQTQQALAQTAKLSVDAQMAALEVVGGGDLDPEKRFDFETKLRKEYSDQTKGYQETREAYERVKASRPDAVGDLSLIFAYMKMLDPGSVVREGEFANAQNAAGVPDRVINIYNRLREGERLTDGQRKTFTGQAKLLMDAAEKREKVVRSGLEGVIKSYRLNPDNVFYEAKAPGQDAPAATPKQYGFMRHAK